MVKNNRGITILGLIITILILVILTGVSINMGFSTIKEIRVGRIISNMTMVKAKVETIYEENQFNQTPLIGEATTLLELSKEEKERVGMDDSWNWYKWTSVTLQNQGLDPQMLAENEFFLVNYEHAEIVYSKGTSLDGKITYHSLTGLRYALENE